jgi:hypothetical protein
MNGQEVGEAPIRCGQAIFIYETSAYMSIYKIQIHIQKPMRIINAT